MAKQIKENKKKEFKKAEFKGFVNYELTTEEKVEMRAWIRDLEKAQIELDEMLAGLYQIKVFKNVATKSYQATAFCSDSESVNAGLLLQAHAPHWFDALCCLAYKHAVVLKGDWTSIEDTVDEVWG